MIDLTKYDKAEVLMVLYENSKPQGMGFLNFTPEPMTKVQAQELLTNDHYFDYIQGRVMKIDLSGDELNPRLYDRDNGEGAAQRAIDTICDGSL